VQEAQVAQVALVALVVQAACRPGALEAQAEEWRGREVQAAEHPRVSNPRKIVGDVCTTNVSSHIANAMTSQLVLV
jgi:hypothetical protein